MVRTGAYAYAKYGWEDNDNPDVYAGTATIDRSFGQKTSVGNWTLTTNRINMGKLGQVEPTAFAYGQQQGTLGINFILADTTSHEIFRGIFGVATGAGTTGNKYIYGGDGTQGQAKSKTFIGNTFSTEIGFTGETDTMIRTLKGCILNSLSITAAINDTVNCSADVIYGKEDAVSNSASAAATESSQPFTFAHGELQVNGSTIAELQDVDINFTQNGDLLYSIGSQQAVTAIKRTLDITGRFRASWKNDDLIAKTIAQLKGTGYSETVGGNPEFKLTFTNGASSPKSIVIHGYGLGIADHNVSGLEPVEPVFEEINWQIKSAKVEVVNQ